MPDNISEVYGLPVNTEGEVVARLGSGGRGVAGSLPRDFNPVNNQGELVVNLAPVDADSLFVTSKIGEIASISKMTQSQYDALVTKDAETLYVIVG